MARLYIFAIGGTGSRVLKSLSMLLAAGVKAQTETNFEIVPIIIDPHQANKDKQRTEEILRIYQAIHNKVGDSSGFFSTKINTLDKLVNAPNKVGSTFSYNLRNISDTRFRDYVDYDLMDEANKSLTSLLFSGYTSNKRGSKVDLLDLEMDIGFVGNPNIGSVVLNQFEESEEFREFANNFSNNDRVFIISSIFGGTGAAGFPIVLKNIRNARNNSSIDSKGFLENAKIGAITVMPYFNIKKDENSPIQKSDFIAKTKSALHYYKDNISKRSDSSVNALYYIADDYTGKAYENDPGDEGQKNDAHFIEMASALAIINFMEIPDNDLITNNGRALNPIFREFGIKEDVASVSFLNLGKNTQQHLAKQLSQFYLFNKFIDENLAKSLGEQAWSNEPPEINKNFLSNPFYRNDVSEFMNHFKVWVDEMADNKRTFMPFYKGVELDNTLINLKPEKKLFGSNLDYSYFNDRLSKITKSEKYPTAEEKFIKLFFDATKTILESKFEFFKQL